MANLAIFGAGVDIVGYETMCSHCSDETLIISRWQEGRCVTFD